MRLIPLSHPTIQFEISETDQGQIYSLLTFVWACAYPMHMSSTFSGAVLRCRWEFPVPDNIDDP